jgi:hypothetical protein
MTPLSDDVDDNASYIDSDEEMSGSGGMKIPWDPKDIRITTKTFTIREIFIQITDEELELAPDFQRSFVWPNSKQTRLIESILLGIPLPAFYFNQDKFGAFQVIDGVQRLTTIKQFMSDQLVLESRHLEYLSDLDGKSYTTLDAVTRRRLGATQIVAHVIEPQTPEEVKYDIFSRVNTGGSPLEPQEIRHCMSKRRSRDFLKELIELDVFNKATQGIFYEKEPDGTLKRNDKRMVDRELALRFSAFYASQIHDYAKFNSLDSFLLDFTRRLDRKDDLAEPVLNQIKSAFIQAMDNSILVLGKGAFRKWFLNPKLRKGPLNRAIFESQAVALADYKSSQLAPHVEEIQLGLRKLFDDPKYSDAVSLGTGDYNKVETRIGKTKDLVRSIVK